MQLRPAAHRNNGLFSDHYLDVSPRGAARPTPATLRELRTVHAETAEPARGRRADAAGLERRLPDLVNQAYGLTDEEAEMLRSISPPLPLRLQAHGSPGLVPYGRSPA